MEACGCLLRLDEAYGFLSDTIRDSRVQAVLKNGILPVNFYIRAGDFIAFLVSALSS